MIFEENILHVNNNIFDKNVFSIFKKIYNNNNNNPNNPEDSNFYFHMQFFFLKQ